MFIFGCACMYVCVFSCVVLNIVLIVGVVCSLCIFVVFFIFVKLMDEILILFGCVLNGMY